MAIQGRISAPLDFIGCGASRRTLPTPIGVAPIPARERSGSDSSLRHGAQSGLLGRLGHQIPCLTAHPTFDGNRWVSAASGRDALGLGAFVSRPSAATGRHALGRGRWRLRSRQPGAARFPAGPPSSLLPVRGSAASGGPSEMGFQRCLSDRPRSAYGLEGIGSVPGSNSPGIPRTGTPSARRNPHPLGQSARAGPVNRSGFGHRNRIAPPVPVGGRWRPGPLALRIYPASIAPELAGPPHAE